MFTPCLTRCFVFSQYDVGGGCGGVCPGKQLCIVCITVSPKSQFSRQVESTTSAVATAGATMPVAATAQRTGPGMAHAVPAVRALFPLCSSNRVHDFSATDYYGPSCVYC